MTDNTPSRDSSTDPDRAGLSITRRRLLAASAGGSVGLGAVASPAVALDSSALSGKFSQVVRAGVTIGQYNPIPEAVTHSGGEPSLHVYYDKDKRSSLENWVDATPDRETLSHHPEDGVMTIRAPASDFGLSGADLWFGNGLASRDYIQGLDQNLRVEYIEPVTPGTKDDIQYGKRVQEAPGVGPLEAWRLGSPPIDGVAFDGDMSGGTVDTVRSVLEADSGSIVLPDTSPLTIAVVDTGVNHGDDVFGDGAGGSRIADASKDFVEGETVADVGLSAVEDPNGHGTWIASLLCADPSDSVYQGFLPSANILAIRALDGEGKGSTADIAAGIRYSADQGADIIILSLGAPIYSYELDRALAYAEGKGALSVGACGNDRQGSRYVASPASAPRAVAVGATTVESPSEALSAYYSNHGPHPGTSDFSRGETAGVLPFLGAPGCEVEVMTVQTDGSEVREALTGTSMAGPAVGGVAGQLMAADSDFQRNPEGVRDRLAKTAKPAPKTAETEVGHGMPSAKNAIDGVEPSETQPEAMTSEAASRDDYHRTLSDASGKRLFFLR